MNFAPDIRHKDEHTRLLEIALIAYLIESLFASMNVLLDAGAPKDNPGLHEAALSGRITYRSGIFYGKLTAKISKDLRALGARMEEGRFTLPESSLPVSLRAALSGGRQKSERLHRDLWASFVAALGNMGPAPSGINHRAVGQAVLDDLDAQWGDPGYSPLGAADEYALRAEVAAKALAEETAVRIKAEIEDSLALGSSREELIEILQLQQMVAKRRAHFVAEKEIAAFIAEYRLLRAQGIGSVGYIWETQGDHRVRPDHRHLQGKCFKWEEPPITNTATGARNHPGEDFNCRCYPRILRPQAKRVGVDKRELLGQSIER